MLNSKKSALWEIIDISPINATEKDTKYKSIVTYRVKDCKFVSYLFSTQPAEDYDPSIIYMEISHNIEGKHGLANFPHWSELSSQLRDLIVSTNFHDGITLIRQGSSLSETIFDIAKELDTHPILKDMFYIYQTKNMDFLVVKENAMCNINWYAYPGFGENTDPSAEEQYLSEAETILSELGLTLTDAIRMYVHQIVFHNGIPFPVKLPY